jgi:hypothetical protein
LQLTTGGELKSVRCPTNGRKWFPLDLMQINAATFIDAIVFSAWPERASDPLGT